MSAPDDIFKFFFVFLLRLRYYRNIMNREFDDILEDITERDPRYKPEAYEFIMEALTYTQKKFKASRHVTGDEILIGVRELLTNQFGPMALTVLEHWGVKSTEDLGNIVFNLVENEVLSKTEDDTPECFRNAYSFKEVFVEDYRQNLMKKLSRMRSI